MTELGEIPKIHIKKSTQLIRVIKEDKNGQSEHMVDIIPTLSPKEINELADEYGLNRNDENTIMAIQMIIRGLPYKRPKSNDFMFACIALPGILLILVGLTLLVLTIMYYFI